VLNVISSPFRTVLVQPLMETPLQPTLGFRAIAGAWPSAAIVLITLDGTMKPCPYSNDRETFGVYFLATLWLAKRTEHGA
jgi:hypothetical protein